MTWLRVDDHFPDHRKIDPLTDGAFRLHVSAMCYSSANLTDGHIPTDRVARLMPKYRKQYVAELVECGVWEPTEGGWLVHDFLGYNPCREKVLAEREQAASRMKARRSAERSPERNGARSGGRSATPSRPAVPSEQNSGGLAPVECKNEACSNGWIDNPDDASTVIPCPDCERVPA